MVLSLNLFIDALFPKLILGLYIYTRDKLEHKKHYSFYRTLISSDSEAMLVGSSYYKFHDQFYFLSLKQNFQCAIGRYLVLS
jgi:hypothetical protein